VRKRSLLILLSGFVLFCFFILSCGDGTTGKKKELEKSTEDNPTMNAGTGKFDIDVPEGWSKIDTSSMGMQTVFLLSPTEGVDDDFRENINIVTERVGSMDLEKYTELSRKGMIRMLNNFKEENEGSTTISGEPAHWIDYSHSMNLYSFDVRVYLLKKAGVAYIITATARKGSREKWLPLFEKTVSTFRFK